MARVRAPEGRRTCARRGLKLGREAACGWGCAARPRCGIVCTQGEGAAMLRDLGGLLIDEARCDALRPTRAPLGGRAAARACA